MSAESKCAISQPIACRSFDDEFTVVTNDSGSRIIVHSLGIIFYCKHTDHAQAKALAGVLNEAFNKIEVEKF